MKQTQRATASTQGKPPPTSSRAGGGRGNQSAAAKIPRAGGQGVADDEVGAWLAGADGNVGTAGPRPGGSYVILGGESLADLCEQAYGTPSATGDAFQVLVAVASGLMSAEEAKALRDTNGAVGAIAKYGASWGLTPGTRLFFPEHPARLLSELAPDHLGWEQAGQIEGDIADHQTVMAVEDAAYKGAGPLMAAYDSFALHFSDVSPGEKRSHTHYVKFEAAGSKGLFSASMKFEAAVTVTQEADGTFSAERTLSEGLVILIGKHFDESLKTTGAHSLRAVLAQLDLADALIAAKAAGHDVNSDVLDEAWGTRFGKGAGIEHRKTEETLDIGLSYSDGDTKIGGSVSGETARTTALGQGPNGRRVLGNSMEYASKFEASLEVKDQVELKGTLDAKRTGAEGNPTTTKAGVEASVDKLGMAFGYEQELSGEGASSRTVKLDLVKLLGEEKMVSYLTTNANQRLALATPAVDAVYASLSALGANVPDRSRLRSTIAQVPVLTSIKLKVASDGSVTMTLVSDPGTVSLPALKSKFGAGQKTESVYELAPPKVAPKVAGPSARA